MSTLGKEKALKIHRLRNAIDKMRSSCYDNDDGRPTDDSWITRM
jgi:hypothetical protein